ncbi:MAG: TetR/AcrR family transcriptional regulator [Caulobacterales bacterium]
MLRSRETQKQATRRRVLDAARDLFEEIGYDEATIRLIAKRAGVSVGSVFTTFRSKAHVLSQVMQDRLSDLYAEMDRLLPHLRGSSADRCRSMFAVHYAFEMRRARLFLAFIAAAYDWRAESEVPVFGSNPHLRGMVRDCLVNGVARGDVRADIDFELAVDLLIAAYAWNYRLAAAEGADSERLIAAMDRQIGVIFDGLAPAVTRR